MTVQNGELHDAREQLAASREILAALGRDMSNPGTVLETVLEYAARLCGAAAAQLFIRDGDTFRLSRVSGETPEEYRRYLLAHPIARNRSSTVGRAAEDKSTVQIPDVLADADYGRLDLQRLTGFRTLLSTPMILEDEVVGVLAMWRTDVAPFDDRERQLLEEFAVQAAIVLRQVDLMRALESRGTELSDKVEQLEALREVDEAVGSSLDLDEVLERIVTNAVRLTNLGFGDITLSTDGGSILEYDEATDSFHVRGKFGSSPSLWEQLRDIVIDRKSSPIGQAALADQPLEIPDLAVVERDEFMDTVFQDGWRSMLAVPMIAGDVMIGVLVIRRRGTGSYPPDVVELLETFASQSALAIVNARLFRELETQSKELEIASNHKSEFLASMSHELRTPLNAVIGFSEVLLERMFGEVNERQEGYLRDIWNSGRHLLELLNEILDLSKVEAGHMVLDPSTFSVSSALEYTLAMVRERAASHSIKISVDIADDVGNIEADELRFKQVVLNLLSNAVKFTPDGGRVSVAAHRKDTELVVTVTDTGIGVPVEDQEKIFDSFQQGGRGPAREEGTGLGLTLSRRIVGLFGGRMWIESTVGVGSTFGFAIPVATRSADAMTAQDGEFPVVVLVDDDRASLDLMSAYLDDAPVQVIRATDGVSGLELIRKVLPAAVVLDIKLPLLDGWEVLAALKAAEDTAGIPVVIASVVDDRPRGTALGADAQLLKPVSRDDLIGALRSVGVPKKGGRLMDDPVTVLAVDDQSVNLRLLDAVLSPRGHRVISAASGAEALSLLDTEDVDLVLSDVVMPEMDGYEVCRRIRSNPATEFLPVVMITASGSEQRLNALLAGADDFITKPFDQSELLARVASLARIKRYHDTIRRQTAELAAWNTELESRVAEQVTELERTSRLRRFLSPQLADLVISDEHLLESHRREIVVVFADMRNFTPFAETSEPEEVMGVLGEYHHAMGALVHRYEGTLERFTGDGVMVFFNDPIQHDDAAERAVRMALEIRDAVSELAVRWRRKGYDLALGQGIAQGYATLGRIGFEGRFDYAAIGSVTNLAARLCSDAGPWEVRVTDRILAAIEHMAVAEQVGDVQPKGFSRTVRVHNISAINEVNTHDTNTDPEPDSRPAE